MRDSFGTPYSMQYLALTTVFLLLPMMAITQSESSILLKAMSKRIAFPKFRLSPSGNFLRSKSGRVYDPWAIFNERSVSYHQDQFDFHKQQFEHHLQMHLYHVRLMEQHYEYIRFHREEADRFGADIVKQTDMKAIDDFLKRAEKIGFKASSNGETRSSTISTTMSGFQSSSSTIPTKSTTMSTTKSEITTMSPTIKSEITTMSTTSSTTKSTTSLPQTSPTRPINPNWTTQSRNSSPTPKLPSQVNWKSSSISLPEPAPLTMNQNNTIGCENFVCLLDNFEILKTTTGFMLTNMSSLQSQSDCQTFSCWINRFQIKETSYGFELVDKSKDEDQKTLSDYDDIYSDFTDKEVFQFGQKQSDQNGEDLLKDYFNYEDYYDYQNLDK